jgi:hypothetical protein
VSINIETGKTYVVYIKDGSTAEVLHKYSKKEAIIYNIGSISKSIFKVLAILISVVFPPLLFITMPLMRRGKRVK